MNANRILFCVFVIILVCGGGSVFAQKSKTQLEKEKKENIKKIEETRNKNPEKCLDRSALCLKRKNKQY
jgi:hypothetical protein